MASGGAYDMSSYVAVAGTPQVGVILTLTVNLILTLTPILSICLILLSLFVHLTLLQVDSCHVFGLTPQEVRYLKVRKTPDT